MMRKVHDTLAAFVHSASVALIVLDRDTLTTTPAYALLVMQSTAAAFHLFYVALYAFSDFERTQNQYKWIEYAISATAGTVAVLTVDEVDLSLVIPLSIVAVLQQAAGLGLDPLRVVYKAGGNV